LNPNVHHRLHKSAPLSLSWARSIQSIPLNHISVRSILILSSHPDLDFRWCLFPSGFHIKILYIFFFSLYVLHALSILLYLIVLIIFREVYKLGSSSLCRLSSLLQLHPSLVQTFSSTPYSHTLPLMTETKFHTHTKSEGNYSFALSNFYVSIHQRRKKSTRILFLDIIHRLVYI
jgi:hypothetical protein